MNRTGQLITAWLAIIAVTVAGVGGCCCNVMGSCCSSSSRGAEVGAAVGCGACSAEPARPDHDLPRIVTNRQLVASTGGAHSCCPVAQRGGHPSTGHEPLGDGAQRSEVHPALQSTTPSPKRDPLRVNRAAPRHGACSCGGHHRLLLPVGPVDIAFFDESSAPWFADLTASGTVWASPPAVQPPPTSCHIHAPRGPPSA